MIIRRNVLAALVSVFSTGNLCADPVAPVDLSAIDLSANVIESVLPGGTVFHDSKPVFGATADPLQSSELLHLSDTGVNASGRSTNIHGAFASSLAESDGNGGVGVSQLIFGPGDPGQDGVRQLVAQSLWTDTFVYDGPAAHDFLHLNIPTLQVGLLGVPPRRTGQSKTETAEARAEVDSVITHPDGTMAQGLFQFGLREFEIQTPSGKDILNLADKQILESPNPLVFTPVLRFNGDDFNPSYTLDPVALDLDLGVIQAGDTMSWVYMLTAQGTTHGFERGYFAFLGDPFGDDVVTGNLTQTIREGAAVPEASSSTLMLLGFAGLLLTWRWRDMRSLRSRLKPEQSIGRPTDVLGSLSRGQWLRVHHAGRRRRQVRGPIPGACSRARSGSFKAQLSVDSWCLQPKSASSPFSSVHMADLEGQLTVDLTSSRIPAIAAPSSETGSTSATCVTTEVEFFHPNGHCQGK
jgi:hypothetical protein